MKQNDELFYKWPKTNVLAGMIINADDPSCNWPMYPTKVVQDSTFGK